MLLAPALLCFIFGTVEFLKWPPTASVCAYAAETPKVAEKVKAPILLEVFKESGVLKEVNEEIASGKKHLSELAENSGNKISLKLNQLQKPVTIALVEQGAASAVLANAYKKRALLYEKAGKYELAEADFKDAVALYPVIYCYFAAYRERRGQFMQAQEYWQKSLDYLLKSGHWGHSGELVRGQAEFLERSEKFDQIEQKCSDSGNSCGRIWMGRYYERRSNQAKALSYFEPEKVAHYGIASAATICYSDMDETGLYYERQGKLDKAEEALKVPGSYTYEKYKNSLAWFYERQGKLAQTEGMFSNVGAFGMHPDPFLRQRARFYERHGRFAEALSDIDGCLSNSTGTLRIDRKTGDDSLTRVRLLAELGKNDQAKEAAIDLLKTDKLVLVPEIEAPLVSLEPDKQIWPEADINFHCRRAQLLLALGRPQDALAALACSDIDGCPWALLSFGRALEKCGNRGAAVVYYKLCLRDYVADCTKTTSIDDALCASWASKALGSDAAPIRFSPPLYVKGFPLFPPGMSFKPLLFFDLANSKS